MEVLAVVPVNYDKHDGLDLAVEKWNKLKLVSFIQKAKEWKAAIVVWICSTVGMVVS